MIEKLPRETGVNGHNPLFEMVEKINELIDVVNYLTDRVHKDELAISKLILEEPALDTKQEPNGADNNGNPVIYGLGGGKQEKFIERNCKTCKVDCPDIYSEKQGCRNWNGTDTMGEK